MAKLVELGREQTPAHSRKSAVSDAWIFFGLLTMLVWAPLPLGSNRTWAIGILLLFAVVLLVGTCVVWRRHADEAVQQLNLFRWPLGLLGSMVMLSWLQTLALPAAWVNALSPMAATAQAPAEWMTLSLDVFQTRTMASLSFVYFTIFLVTVLAVRDAARLERVAQTLVFSGVLQVVIGTLLLSAKADYRIFFVKVAHVQMLGTYINQNHLAGYLCMCLSVGIGLMLARLSTGNVRHTGWRSRLNAMIEFLLSSKMRLRLLLVVMVIGLVLTRSRMGNAAFFSALLAVGFLAIILMRKNAPQTIVLVASLVVIDVLVVGTWVGLEKVVERIQGTEVMASAGGKSESIEARTEAARTALALVKDFPLVGTGGGSFYNLFLSYRTPDYGDNYVDHTHNDFVEIATDYGLLGLGILGALVASSLWVVLRVMRRRKSPLPRGIAFGVAMSMVALLIHSTVDFNLQIPANALTMVVILAMGWVTQALPSPRTRKVAEQGGI